MKRVAIITLIGMVTLTGCASVNGLSDSSNKFGCKAPDGVSCTSVSGVYANAQQDNLPALQAYRKAPLPTANFAAASAGPLPIAMPGMPIRSQSRVLRIWVAPWVDDDGALHDQSFMYVVVDPGKWLVEHSREATVRKTMTRLRVLGQTNANIPAAQPVETAGEQSPQAAAIQAAVVPGDKEEPK